MFFDPLPNIHANVLYQSALPSEVIELGLDEIKLVYTSNDLTELTLRKLCSLLGEIVRCHYEVRCTNNPAQPNEFSVTRTMGNRRIHRSDYPYDKIGIMECFRVDKCSDPIEQNLRVHTSRMGKELKRKFSVSYFETENVFIIQRTA